MAIVGLLLLLATAGFTLRVTARGGAGAIGAIPPVSHAVDESTADCASCHEVGEEGLPRSHRTYHVPTCLTCHRLSPAAP